MTKFTHFLLFILMLRVGTADAMQDRLFTPFRAEFFERRARDFVRQNSIAADDLQPFLDELNMYMRRCGELLFSAPVCLAMRVHGSICGFDAADIVVGLDPHFLDRATDPIVYVFAQWNLKNHEHIVKDLLGCCVERPDDYDRPGLRRVEQKEFDRLIERLSDQFVTLIEANTFEFALAISREFLPKRKE